MSFDPGMYMPEEALSELIGSLVSFIGTNVLSAGFGILTYVFTALSLYSIAQRRGIKNPWMAWIPVLNIWILGSISDQYRYVVKGQICNRRKVLVVLKVLQIVCVIAVIVLLVAAVIGLAMNGAALEMMSGSEIGAFMLKQFLPVFGALGIMGVTALINVVFTAMCYYDLFASCEPDNKVLYLVLGLLIGITLPIFVFICRNKDLGMPARRAEQPQPAPEVIPVMEAPAEPWTNPEE